MGQISVLSSPSFANKIFLRSGMFTRDVTGEIWFRRWQTCENLFDDNNSRLPARRNSGNSITKRSTLNLHLLSEMAEISNTVDLFQIVFDLGKRSPQCLYWNLEKIIKNSWKRFLMGWTKVLLVFLVMTKHLAFWCNPLAYFRTPNKLLKIIKNLFEK